MIWRRLRQANMVHNDVCPEITVNPETFEVTADGESLTCRPAEVLPLAQKYVGDRAPYLGFWCLCLCARDGCFVDVKSNDQRP